MICRTGKDQQPPSGAGPHNSREIQAPWHTAWSWQQTHGATPLHAPCHHPSVPEAQGQEGWVVDGAGASHLRGHHCLGPRDGIASLVVQLNLDTTSAEATGDTVGTAHTLHWPSALAGGPIPKPNGAPPCRTGLCSSQVCQGAARLAPPCQRSQRQQSQLGGCSALQAGHGNGNVEGVSAWRSEPAGCRQHAVNLLAQQPATLTDFGDCSLLGGLSITVHVAPKDDHLESGTGAGA